MAVVSQLVIGLIVIRRGKVVVGCGWAWLYLDVVKRVLVDIFVVVDVKKGCCLLSCELLLLAVLLACELGERKQKLTHTGCVKKKKRIQTRLKGDDRWI